MLVALYIFINAVFPLMGATCIALINGLMPAVIVLAGIIMLFGAVGIPLSRNLGSTIVERLFAAVGYIFRQLFEAIGWLIRQLPLLYRWIHQILVGFGLNTQLSSIVAALLILVIIV